MTQVDWHDLGPHAFAAFLARSLAYRGIVSPLDDFVLFGSSVMKLHGLRDQVGDVDVFVSATVYARLRAMRGWEELRPREDDPPLLATFAHPYRDLTIHAFYTWTARDRWIDTPAAFAQREFVEGLPCIPLSMVAQHKQECLRIVRGWGYSEEELRASRWGKHLADISAIEAVAA